MNSELIISILSDSNLSEKEKLEKICHHLKECSIQPNHILNCYRVLNTLKFELSELAKDADPGSERIFRRVTNAITTELDIDI